MKKYLICSIGCNIRSNNKIGQAYDASDNPIVQDQQLDFCRSSDKQNNDLSTNSVLNTFVLQDFDDEDTEPAFTESQNYVSNGLYVPYLSDEHKHMTHQMI